jgi:hypothetical protein
VDRITVLTEESPNARPRYCAVSGEVFAVGDTLGGALDGLAEKVGPATATTVVVLQPMKADEFFTEEQRRRLGDLMTRWKSESLAPGELEELHALVRDELDAATRRSAALLRNAKP